MFCATAYSSRLETAFISGNDLLFCYVYFSLFTHFKNNTLSKEIDSHFDIRRNCDVGKWL